jgi:hypothetical protein
MTISNAGNNDVTTVTYCMCKEASVDMDVKQGLVRLLPPLQMDDDHIDSKDKDYFKGICYIDDLMHHDDRLIDYNNGKC